MSEAKSLGRHPDRLAPDSLIRADMAEIPGSLISTPAFNPSFPRQDNVSVRTFWTDRTEVTNASYAEFVKGTGYFAPSVWKTGWYASGEETVPVTGVSLVDAMFYCAWRGVRLPTLEEWELAAYGPDGRKFPWGDELDPEAFSSKTPPVAVGSYPKSGGVFALHDIVGNAWEWTVTPLLTDTNKQVIHGSALVCGGGDLSLEDTDYYPAETGASDSLFSGISLFQGPLMMFWDERVSLPPSPGWGIGSRMWGATVTSRDFAYWSVGSGQIFFGFGGGSFPKAYPSLCILRCDFAFRCESIGFRCASN